MERFVSCFTSIYYKSSSSLMVGRACCCKFYFRPCRDWLHFRPRSKSERGESKRNLTTLFFIMYFAWYFVIISSKLMCFLYLYIYLIAASEFWSSSTEVERWDWLHNIWCCSKWWKHSADFLLMIAVIVCFTSLTKEEKDQASCKGIIPYSWNDFLLVVCVFSPCLTFFFFFFPHWACFESRKKALEKSFLMCSSLYFFSGINSIYNIHLT